MFVDCGRLNLGRPSPVHLHSIHQLLLAAAKRPKIVDPHCEIVVREMVDLGLVDATLADGRTKKFTAIHRLTSAGKRFLRVVEGQHCALLNVYRRRRDEANGLTGDAPFTLGEASDPPTGTPAT